MKVETQQPSFTPIVITLETVEEVMILRNLIGPTSGLSRWSALELHEPGRCPFSLLYERLVTRIDEHTES